MEWTSVLLTSGDMMTSHWGALISYVGPTPPPTGSYVSTEVASQAHFISLVGSQFSGTLLYAGELWLGFNDDAYSNNTSDNSGEVTATITVTSGQSGDSAQTSGSK
jgi:hypothetical protein